MFQRILSDLGALQGCQVSTASQGLSDVAGQGAYVGAFAAGYPDFDDGQAAVEQFDVVNMYGFGLQFYVFSLAGKVVGPFTLNLAG